MTPMEIQNTIDDLKNQQSGIDSQLTQTQGRASSIEEQQRQLSVPAFNGDDGALKKFEELSEETIRLAQREKGLLFASGRIREQLQDAETRLQEAERSEKRVAQQHLADEILSQVAKAQAALNSYARFIDEIAGFASQIEVIDRQLGGHFDSGSVSRVLGWQVEQELRRRFPGFMWGAICYRRDFNAAESLRAHLEQFQEPEVKMA
ncbi:MAG: hypothetical protein JXA73_00185 [Acidobacteria bacterium]|nr:hypothetical protein [Acidobacteriota bacterium]